MITGAGVGVAVANRMAGSIVRRINAADGVGVGVVSSTGEMSRVVSVGVGVGVAAMSVVRTGGALEYTVSRLFGTGVAVLVASVVVSV